MVGQVCFRIQQGGKSTLWGPHPPLHTADLAEDLGAPWSDTVPHAVVLQWSVGPLTWARLCLSLGKQAWGFLKEASPGLLRF